MTATFPVVKRCPYRDETDQGTAEITWTTLGGTMELHELAAFFAEFRDETISHEDMTHRAAEALDVSDAVIIEEVVTRWNTAGAEVVVRAVPGQYVLREST